jgi:hypothetical protein
MWQALRCYICESDIILGRIPAYLAMAMDEDVTIIDFSLVACICGNASVLLSA